MLMRIRINSRMRKSHSLLMGMQTGTATLEDNLAVSYKTKHSLTIRSIKGTFRYFSSLIPIQNLHANIYNNFIHNRKN